MIKQFKSMNHSGSNTGSETWLKDSNSNLWILPTNHRFFKYIRCSKQHIFQISTAISNLDIYPTTSFNHNFYLKFIIFCLSTVKYKSTISILTGYRAQTKITSDLPLHIRQIILELPTRLFLTTKEKEELEQDLALD